MKNVYIISFIILSFLSCNDEGHPTIIEAYVDAYVIDKDGNDLLDPDNSSEKRINLERLQLVYLMDNEEIIYYKGNLEAPRGFFLIPPEGKYNNYSLRIFPNVNYTTSTSYLKWDELDVDTLTVEVYKKTL